MYDKILVPLDGTTSAEAALNHVENLVRGSKVEVVLLRVLPEPQSQGIFNQKLTTIDWTAEREKTDALDYLNGMAWRLQLYNVKTDKAIRFGEPAKEIVDFAKESDVDLIVMTSNKDNGLASMLRTDTAKKVMRKARKPVLLVKPGTA